MFKIKILTFLTLPFLLNFTIRADIDYSQQIEFTGAFDRIKISKRGLFAGENLFNYPSYPYNGIYHAKDLDLNFTKIGLQGARITDLDVSNDEIFTTNYMWMGNNAPGLYKTSLTNNTSVRIGRGGSLNRVHILKEKVYYGGNNYGAWVINKDGTNNKQLLGGDGYGPQIDQIKSNSKNVYFLSRGYLYFTPYETDSLTQLFPIYKIYNIEPTENLIMASSNDNFLHLDFQGKILYEKRFSGPIGTIKKYQNYLFLTETYQNEIRIWISNDLGKSFFQSKTKFNYLNSIKDIELTGTDDMTIFINVASKAIIKAKFKFDFEEQKFLGTPFKRSNSNELVDRITSFFDHRYPYLGNSSEPSQYSDTTLNFYGQELKQPFLYYSSHDGIDFGLPIYSNVLAAEKGKATYGYNQFGLGHTITISHPNNFITVYGHLDENNLITKTSKEVVKGEIIGKVGMSGNTNGPHLHFTVYKGKKELNNKIDPFGWNGNFEDPWVKKSVYLWDEVPKPLNQVVKGNQNNQIYGNNLELKLDLISDENSYHLTLYPVAPIFNKNNFKYKEYTSYKMNLSDLLNENVVAFASLRFKGFTNPQDEKKYSIFKYDGQSLIKMETLFDNDKNILSTYTSVEGQYMVLENNYKKITTRTNFNTN